MGEKDYRILSDGVYGQNNTSPAFGGGGIFAYR